MRYGGEVNSAGVETVDRVHEYHKYAAACVLLSEQVRERDVKAKLLILAQEWARLAAQVENNIRRGLLSDTAPPSMCRIR